mmetsp:Transcript_26974/g.58972  ORF Transcript_26974/g.58972 Transcript_26974/m.58972 type:complete len:222 (-) Transcript_26974:1199-1864(-)
MAGDIWIYKLMLTWKSSQTQFPRLKALPRQMRSWIAHPLRYSFPRRLELTQLHRLRMVTCLTLTLRWSQSSRFWLARFWSRVSWRSWRKRSSPPCAPTRNTSSRSGTPSWLQHSVWRRPRSARSRRRSAALHRSASVWSANVLCARRSQPPPSPAATSLASSTLCLTSWPALACSMTQCCARWTRASCPGSRSRRWRTSARGSSPARWCASWWRQLPSRWC